MGTYTFNHPELLERDEKDIFFKNFGMQELMYTKLFTTKTSTKAYEDGMRVAGLGTFHTKPEGTPVGFDDPVSAARVRTVHTTYALGFRVTMEAEADQASFELTRWRRLTQAGGPNYRQDRNVVGHQS